MHGDFFGGVLALLYFLAFQACGMLLAACFFKTERRYVRAVLGSAAGSVLLMWLPALWAFALGFSVWAHLLALALLLLVTALALWRRRPAARAARGAGACGGLCQKRMGVARARAALVRFCWAFAAQLPGSGRRDLVEPVHLR